MADMLRECEHCFCQLRWHRIEFHKGVRLPGYDLVARCVSCKRLHENDRHVYVAKHGSSVIYLIRKVQLESLAFMDCIGDSVEDINYG